LAVESVGGRERVCVVTCTLSVYCIGSWWLPLWHDYHFLNRNPYKSHLVSVTIQQTSLTATPTNFLWGESLVLFPRTLALILPWLPATLLRITFFFSHYLSFQLTVCPRPLTSCFFRGKMRHCYPSLRTFFSTQRRAQAKFLSG
jgi:hypothetical protein